MVDRDTYSYAKRLRKGRAARQEALGEALAAGGWVSLYHEAREARLARTAPLFALAEQRLREMEEQANVQRALRSHR